MLLNSLRFVVLLDLLLFFALQNHGCTGGKVIDEYGLPVIGAKAVCDDLPASGPVFSDGTGMYKWPDGLIPEGPHSFTISMLGFESVTLKAVVKYGVAPGHTAAEGLVFQIPDLRLRRPSAVSKEKNPASTLPPPTRPPPSTYAAETVPAPTTTLPAVPAMLFPTLPPNLAISVPSTVTQTTMPGLFPNPTAAAPPPPTFPPAAVPRPKPPAVVESTARSSLPASAGSTVAAPAAPALTPVIPPGQQWYRSPDQKYSFSAPLDWRVGFQGSKAVIRFEKNGCVPLQITVQVNDGGRPREKVLLERNTVLSGLDVQIRTYESGTEGYFFSCGGDQYAAFKSAPGKCVASGQESLEQEAMLILTSLQCRR